MNETASYINIGYTSWFCPRLERYVYECPFKNTTRAGECEPTYRTLCLGRSRAIMSYT